MCAPGTLASPAPYDVFPPVMVARCERGHLWRVRVSWHETLQRPDGTMDPHALVPYAEPYYCGRCFLEERRAAPLTGLMRIEHAPADLPIAEEEG